MKTTKLTIIALTLGSNFAFSQSPCLTTKTQTVKLPTLNEVPFSVPPSDGTPKTEPTKIPTGDKLVFWVNGIGGDETTWSRAATASGQSFGPSYQPIPGFVPRKITSVTDLQYDESISSFTNAARSLNNKLVLQSNGLKYGNNDTVDRREDFIIAHSQGGLVSRFIDRDLHLNGTGSSFLPRTFGGIVTFGTPHAGAEIISDLGAKLRNLTEGTCNDLASGPLAEKIDKNWVLSLFGLSKTIANFSCSIIGGSVGVVAKMKTAGLAQEYKPNAPFLTDPVTGLNNYNTTTPGVAFYGIEEPDGIAFKTLYSFTMEDPNSVDYFKAHETDKKATDEAYYTFVKYKSKRDYYRNSAERNKNRAIASTALSIFGLPFAGYYYYQYKIEDNIASSYQSGVSRLATLDNSWLNVIGALEKKETKIFHSYSYCKCPGDAELGNDLVKSGSKASNSADFSLRQKYHIQPTTDPLNGPLPCPDNPNPNCQYVNVYYTETQTEINIKPSDGVVLAESASAFPGLKSKNVIFMKSSNHGQMKNDENTKTGLNTLYDGFLGRNFKTEPR